jgi:hypothetical protein
MASFVLLNVRLLVLILLQDNQMKSPKEQNPNQKGKLHKNMRQNVVASAPTAKTLT